VLTAAQAQYFDMIAILRTRQSKQGRRKKHGFIVWMGYEQQYAFVLQCRKGCAQSTRVHPEAEKYEGHRGPGEPIHPGELRGVYVSICSRATTGVALMSH
jgi:hypothetical protein